MRRLGEGHREEAEQGLPQIVLLRAHVPEYILIHQISGIRRIDQIEIIPAAVEVCAVKGLGADMGEQDHHPEQDPRRQHKEPLCKI